MSELNNLVHDMVASPLGDVIAAVGRGVADAQQALDEGSLAKTLEVYSEGGSEVLNMLRDLGYSPTFYTLPETTGEVRIAMRLGSTQGANIPSSQPSVVANLARTGLNLPAIQNKIYATPVDASYANRFGYQADISAKLTFKIVPVPPPNGVDELRVVPNLVGAKASDAMARLSALQLNGSFVNTQGKSITLEPGDQLILNQIPVIQGDKPPIVRAGQEVILTVDVGV
jgi:hypothetical protein